jgi:D-tyrosyl-tRNA(Tyr) deacylase
MRAVLQRVSGALVKVDGQRVAGSGNGLLVLLGVGKNDTEQDAEALLDKIVTLRIFEGPGGDMDVSLLDTPDATLTVISQFTLYGDCRKGRRPSFSNAAPPARAVELYRHFLESAAQYPLHVEAGRFGAMMAVSLENRGPVTILLDSKREF